MVRMLCDYLGTHWLHTLYRVTMWRGASLRASVRRGDGLCLCRPSVGQREVVGALLEADDAVADVLGVRKDGSRDDPHDVVREVVRGVEARVAGAVAPTLPVFGTTGKEAQAPGAAAPYATERLYNERHYLITLFIPRVVVVALEEGHVTRTCLVVKGPIRGLAAFLGTHDGAGVRLLGAAEGHQVAHVLAVVPFIPARAAAAQDLSRYLTMA